jgi:phosphoserine aminotransferase
MNQNYERLYNFSAGPAVLPLPVLERVRDELLNYKKSGFSVMEMSHRSKEFDEILATAEANVRKLTGLGDDTSVLFLQGGASLQFSMVPMNLAQAGRPVDMIHTGYWTEMAIQQLKKGFDFRLAATGEPHGFKRLPTPSEIELSPNASYVHMCTNNTIYGTQWKQIPNSPHAPLVADMSSDIFSRQLDFGKFGVVFAGAQKNLGPSGVCLVLIKKDLAERAPKHLPSMLEFRSHIKAGSRYNTPPAFGIYVCGLVLQWLVDQGGLPAIEERNEKKASLLYKTIESSQFFKCPVETSSRSTMNVVFRIQPGQPNSEALEDTFVKEARKAGFAEIKGHRATGGLRASIYNAFPEQGVIDLCSFMKDFERRQG